MTAGVLVSSAFKLHGHEFEKDHRLCSPSLVGKSRNRHHKHNKSIPKVAKYTNKPQNLKNVKVRLKIDLKGKRHPNVFKKTVRVKINRGQIKRVLLRQILIEEKSALKMLGVAVFYAGLLEHIKTAHERNASPVCCPFCKLSRTSNPDSTMTQDLVEKLERDVCYLLNYATNSTSRKEKAKYFHALESHGLVSSKLLGKKRHSEVNYLRTSDKFLTRTDNLCSMDLFQGIENIREVVQGKKEALKLLKVQILKSKKCGVCDGDVPGAKLGSILGAIDKRLSALQRV